MSVRKSVAWSFFAQGLSFVVAFIGSVIVTRLLSPYEIGIFAIAMATAAIIQVAGMFGVSAYVVRERDLTNQTLDSAFTVNAVIALVISATIFMASFGGKLLLGDPGAGHVLALIALNPLISIFGFHPATMMQREMQFKQLALIGSITAVFGTAVTIASAWSGASYMSAAYGTVASNLLMCIAYNVAAFRHQRLRVSFMAWRSITRFGLRIMSISGLAVMTSRMCDIIIGRFIGIIGLGIYSRAANLSNTIFDNVYGTATRIVFTQMSKDYRERGELRTSFIRGLQLITGVMWPFLAGLAVLSSPAIHIIYGKTWAAAALPLSLLLVGQMIALGFAMNWELFVIKDEVALQTKLEVWRSAFTFFAFGIGCQFGLAGAALGRVADAIMGLIVYAPHMKRLAQSQPGELGRVYAQSALLAFAASAPALLLMSINHWSPQPSLPALLGAIACGVALWLLALMLMRHPLNDELKLVLRTLRLVPRHRDYNSQME